MWNHYNLLFIYLTIHLSIIYISGLVQNCGISIANALEIPLFCTKPST